MEVFFDGGYTEPPVPKGSKIYYHCDEGHFPNGKTWHVGLCKNGEFTVTKLQACTTDKVDAGDDDDEDEKPRKSKKSGVKRTAQKGGKRMVLFSLFC